MSSARPMSDEYMTLEEFAALTADEHHAVWAAGEHRIDTIPVNTGDIRRWHRAQVRRLLDNGEVPGE